jgi:hypothetical protein
MATPTRMASSAAADYISSAEDYLRYNPCTTIDGLRHALRSAHPDTPGAGATCDDEESLPQFRKVLAEFIHNNPKVGAILSIIRQHYEEYLGALQRRLHRKPDDVPHSAFVSTTDDLRATKAALATKTAACEQLLGDYRRVETELAALRAETAASQQRLRDADTLFTTVQSLFGGGAEGPRLTAAEVDDELRLLHGGVLAARQRAEAEQSVHAAHNTQLLDLQVVVHDLSTQFEGSLLENLALREELLRVQAHVAALEGQIGILTDRMQSMADIVSAAQLRPGTGGTDSSQRPMTGEGSLGFDMIPSDRTTPLPM